MFGTVTALLHDIGYIRHLNDSRHLNGAEYTRKHVPRCGKFMEEYLTAIGFEDIASLARQIVHFTGYERPISQISVPSMIFHLLGSMLGAADIIAQMSDRCYLEKCHDRLYPEFVAGGLAPSTMQHAVNGMLFSSAEELVSRTPVFYRTALARLNDALGGAHNFAETRFGGQNLYLDEIDKNVGYSESVAASCDLELLRRTPPPVERVSDSDVIPD